MAKTKIKQYLGRVGYLMLRDGTLEIKGNNRPVMESKELSELLAELEACYDFRNFEKPDYFANFTFVEGLLSSEEFIKKGM